MYREESTHLKAEPALTATMIKKKKKLKTYLN